jgi:hypothetical protein
MTDTAPTLAVNAPAPITAPAVQAPATIPLLLNATRAADYCGFKRGKWNQMNNAGHIPAPVRFGGSGDPYWVVADLELWARWGCPSRERFETMKKAEAGRKGARA